MKKIMCFMFGVIISLVLAFGSVSYSADKCLGPYDFDTLHTNYREIIDEFWAGYVATGNIDNLVEFCPIPEGNSFGNIVYVEHGALKQLRMAWIYDGLSEVHRKYNPDKTIHVELAEQSYTLKFLVDNIMRTSARSDPTNRSVKWLVTKYRWEKAFKSSSGYKLMMKQATDNWLKKK